IGATQTSSDVVFGLKLDVDVTTSGGAGALVLNEVLSINSTLQNPDGSFVGWIELFNPTATPISLADLSISNEIDTPRKFVFPVGTTIAAGGYYVVQCNPLAAASATNTGFELTSEGGTGLFFENLPPVCGSHAAI